MSSPRARTNFTCAVGRALRSAALLLTALQALSARAQVTPDVTPPRAEGSTEVPYPDGASGDAAVLLELVVEADGAVSSAVVVEGDEPFAGRARAAALQWRFTPAARDGAPVSARIRARVAFTEERPPDAADAAAPAPAASVPALPPSPASAAVAAAAPDPLLAPPLDVTIRGRRREAGQTTLSDADVRAMPGAFGDPFRAIEALPSVIPLVSGLPYFSIRGAPANNNGYYVDGIRVPLLFHVGVGQGRHPPGPHRSRGLLSGRGAGQLRRRRGRGHRRTDQGSSAGAARTGEPAPHRHGRAGGVPGGQQPR